MMAARAKRCAMVAAYPMGVWLVLSFIVFNAYFWTTMWPEVKAKYFDAQSTANVSYPYDAATFCPYASCGGCGVVDDSAPMCYVEVNAASAASPSACAGAVDPSVIAANLIAQRGRDPPTPSALPSPVAQPSPAPSPGGNATNSTGDNVSAVSVVVQDSVDGSAGTERRHLVHPLLALVDNTTEACPTGGGGACNGGYHCCAECCCATCRSCSTSCSGSGSDSDHGGDDGSDGSDKATRQRAFAVVHDYSDAELPAVRWLLDNGSIPAVAALVATNDAGRLRGCTTTCSYFCCCYYCCVSTPAWACTFYAPTCYTVTVELDVAGTAGTPPFTGALTLDYGTDVAGSVAAMNAFPVGRRLDPVYFDPSDPANTLLLSVAPTPSKVAWSCVLGVALGIPVLFFFVWGCVACGVYLASTCCRESGQGCCGNGNTAIWLRERAVVDIEMTSRVQPSAITIPSGGNLVAEFPVRAELAIETPPSCLDYNPSYTEGNPTCASGPAFACGPPFVNDADNNDINDGNNVHV